MPPPEFPKNCGLRRLLEFEAYMPTALVGGGDGQSGGFGEKRRPCFRREGESAFMGKQMIWGEDRCGL